MHIKIIKGNMNHINDCKEALINSELGKRYFTESGRAKKALEEGFSKEEIYLAVDINNNCMGFLWFILGGAFHSFPYLHIIAVKEESRNNGVGRKLLQYFEDICFKDFSKVFLVVGDFNPDAKRLYEEIGYIEVGCLPSLYREGINEHLMMKIREELIK